MQEESGDIMMLFNETFMDKKDASIQLEDRGYQFGDGVYEVIRVYDGACFEMDAHLDRLERSANKIRMQLPYVKLQIKLNLLKLVEENNLINGTIYIQITRGVAVRTHHFPKSVVPVLTAYVQQSERPTEKTQYGVSAILTEDIRWSRCDIKSLNLLGSVLVKQEAKDQNYEEAILHRNGVITEGASTNVFLIKKDKLYTPPADNLILEGITRNKAMAIARENKIEVSESTFTIDDLFSADEVFITSTTLELTPIVNLGGEKIGNGAPGEITRRLQQGYEEAIREQLNK